MEPKEEVVNNKETPVVESEKFESESGVKGKGSARKGLDKLKDATNEKHGSSAGHTVADSDDDTAENNEGYEEHTGSDDQKDADKSEKDAQDTYHEDGEGNKGEDGDSLVEVDGKKYFYHPEVHAEGENTHPNAYKDREAAEDAALAKLERMQERVDKLKEAKKSVKTLGLPKAVDNDPDKLSGVTEDAIIGMSDDELRSFLKESDQFDLKAGKKLDRWEHREKQEQHKKETSERFNQLQQAADDALRELDIDPTAKKYESTDAFFSDVDKAINKAVEREVKPLVDELDKFEADHNKLEDLGQKEFTRQVKQKMMDIQNKRDDLKRQFNEKKQRINEFIDTAREVQGGDTGHDGEQGDAADSLTDADKAKLRKASIDEFAEDMQEANQDINEDKMRAFSSWANRHRTDYNELITTDDVYDAWHDYNKFMDEQRQKFRGSEVVGKGSEARTGSSVSAEDVKQPDPSRQITNDRREENPAKSGLNNLAADLNAKYPFK